MEVSYTGNAYVGKEVTLVTTANGVKVTEGVTYTIEEGSDLASLENDVLTITGEGTIKVKATYVKAGKTLTAEVTINATVVDENITTVTVSFTSDIDNLFIADDSAKTATLTTQGITFLFKQGSSNIAPSQMKRYLSSNSLRFYQGYSMEISVASGTIKAISPDSNPSKPFTNGSISSDDFTVTDIDTVSMINTTSSKISMKAEKQVKINSLEFTLGN